MLRRADDIKAPPPQRKTRKVAAPLVDILCLVIVSLGILFFSACSARLTDRQAGSLIFELDVKCSHLPYTDKAIIMRRFQFFST